MAEGTPDRPVVRRSTLRPVLSTGIAALGYDAKDRTLVVQFIKGHAYRYRNVPAEVYAGLLETESVGRAVHKGIVGNAAYPFERVDIRDEETTPAHA